VRMPTLEFDMVVDCVFQHHQLYYITCIYYRDQEACVRMPTLEFDMVVDCFFLCDIVATFFVGVYHEVCVCVCECVCVCVCVCVCGGVCACVCV